MLVVLLLVLVFGVLCHLLLIRLVAGVGRVVVAGGVGHVVVVVGVGLWCGVSAFTHQACCWCWSSLPAASPPRPLWH